MHALKRYHTNYCSPIGPILCVTKCYQTALLLQSKAKEKRNSLKIKVFIFFISANFLFGVIFQSISGGSSSSLVYNYNKWNLLGNMTLHAITLAET